MLVSGFTAVRNAIKFNYPVVESIKSILPICGEFIVNIGDSEDATLKLIESINNSKIKIIQNAWDLNIKGGENISRQTNVALSNCRGDWAFYLQADEVVHEKDLPRLNFLMKKYLKDFKIEGFRFEYLHFFGSYWRFKNKGWYQKENRIIRNGMGIISVGDGKGFMSKDNQHLKRIKTGASIYHYGWVNDMPVMKQRRLNAEALGFIGRLSDEQLRRESSFFEMEQLPVFLNKHPAVMKQRIVSHDLSREDWGRIYSKNRLNPIFSLRSLKIRRSYYG